MMVGLMSSNVYADAFAMPNEDGIMIFYSFVNINGNEELEITRVPASSSGSIKIPHSINYQGKSIEVTSIGSYAFQNCCYMTSVVIPESVKYVGYNAFEGCSGLTGVYISDLDAWCNISFDYSFSSNPLGFAHHIYLNGIEIQNLIIPNGTTSIKQMTFFGCSGLKSVSFPNSAKSIGGMAFYGCSGLIEVNMSDNIMNIGEYAFGNSNNLENIVFPNSPVRINGTAFNGTAWYNNKPSGLIYAGKIAYKYKGNMPDNTNLFLDDGTLGIASTAFYGCKGLSSIHLPSGLDYIDGSAFDGCSSLVDFTIPSNVTSIGIGILANCDNLLSITVESGNAYYDSRNSCNAIMDTETNKLIAGCKNTSIPDETTEISARAFQGCTGLTTIVIPNKVKSIDSEAFYGCI